MARRDVHGMLDLRRWIVVMFMVFPVSIGTLLASHAAPGDEIVQRAEINESFGYINLSQRGGRPTGPGVDNDGPPPLQLASMQVVFSKAPGVILTNFAFQSKFSESPALGSRIGDKLFSAVQDGSALSPPHRREKKWHLEWAVRWPGQVHLSVQRARTW